VWNSFFVIQDWFKHDISTPTWRKRIAEVQQFINKESWYSHTWKYVVGTPTTNKSQTTKQSTASKQSQTTNQEEKENNV
jgi:hypothetical protein